MEDPLRRLLGGAAWTAALADAAGAAVPPEAAQTLGFLGLSVRWARRHTGPGPQPPRMIGQPPGIVEAVFERRGGLSPQDALVRMGDRRAGGPRGNSPLARANVQRGLWPWGGGGADGGGGGFEGVCVSFMVMQPDGSLVAQPTSTASPWVEGCHLVFWRPQAVPALPVEPGWEAGWQEGRADLRKAVASQVGQCTHPHTRVCGCTRTHLHAHTRTHARARVRTHARTHTHTHAHTRTHAGVRVCAHTHARTGTHASAHTHAHALTRARTHTHARAHAHGSTLVLTARYAQDMPEWWPTSAGEGRAPRMRDRLPRDGAAAQHLQGYMHGLGGLCGPADVKGYVLALCAHAGGGVGGLPAWDRVKTTIAAAALRGARLEMAGGLPGPTGGLDVQNWTEQQVMHLVGTVMEGLSMEHPARSGREGAAATFHEFATPYKQLVPLVKSAIPAVRNALGLGPKVEVQCTEDTLSTAGALGDGCTVATPGACRRIVHYLAGVQDEEPACNTHAHLGARALAITQAQWLAHRYFPFAQLVRIGVLETHPTHGTLPAWLRRALEGSLYAKDPEL